MTARPALCSGAGRVLRSPAGRIAVGVALLGLLAAEVEWDQVATLVAGAGPAGLAGALGLLLATRVVTAAKWRVLMQARALPAGFGRLLAIVWVSNFLGAVLPTAIGGDAVRMWSVARASERPADAVATVLVERLTGFTALVLLAVAGALASLAGPLGAVLAPAVLVPAAAILAALGLLWSAAGRALTRGLAGRLPRRWGRDFLGRLDDATRAFNHHPGPLAIALALAGVVQCCRVWSIVLVAAALGVGLASGEALAVLPPALFVGMLPVSVGGLGVREGGLVVMLGLAGVSASPAFAIAIIWRLLGLLSNLPGGLLLLAGSRPSPAR